MGKECDWRYEWKTWLCQLIGTMIGLAILVKTGFMSFGAAPWDPIVRPGDGPYKVADRQREANQLLDFVTWMTGPGGTYWHAAVTGGINIETGGSPAIAVKKVSLEKIDRFGYSTIDFDERCLWKPEHDCTRRGDGDVDLEDWALYMRNRSGEPTP